MKHYKIICIAQVYNELTKGNLKRFVTHVKPLCDELVVYDDGSTDGSLQYLQKITHHVLKGKKNEFDNEIYHKSLLLEKAKELGADFVFYLDADEVLSSGAKENLQKLAKRCIDKNLDGLQFHKINIWRSHTWQRMDSMYNIGWFTHLWRVKPDTRFAHRQKGLHQIGHPSSLKKIERAKEISVLHYGFADEKNLANKYLTYKSFGQQGYDMLDRLISEEQLKVKRVPQKMFPQGLYIQHEEKPRKKTFLQSLEYVEKYRKSLGFKSLHQKSQLVTIITPTYNRANLLTKTMESILSQDYKPLEYIVIDDGSTDGTRKIVKKFQEKKYPGKKIIYLKQKNIGETKTVNKGLSLAKGEILAVVSSDDPLLPHAVHEIVSFMNKYPDFLAVYPDWRMIDQKDHAIQTVHVADYNYLSMLKDHYCMPGPGTFFRKEAIKLTGGRSEKFKYVADFAFWLKLGLYGQMYHFPKVLASFRVHAGSQGVRAKGKEMASEHKKLVNWIFSDPDMPEEAKNLKTASLSAAYFHSAKESTLPLLKLGYYLKSFCASPFVFGDKIFYEVVKIKHFLRH